MKNLSVALSVVACLLAFPGSSQAQPLVPRTTNQASALTASVSNVVNGPFLMHLHSKRSDGRTTIYQNALKALWYGLVTTLATDHDRWLALPGAGYASYNQEATTVSLLTSEATDAGVEWTIQWRDPNGGHPEDREAHAYLAKSVPTEFQALIQGLSEYAITPDSAYGLHSNWVGKPKSDALLGNLLALSKKYREPLIVAHPDIRKPSLVIDHYFPLPIDQVKGKVDYLGVEVMNHEMFSSPQGVLNIAAAYEAVGVHVCLIAGNDSHELGIFDYPPFYPYRWARRNWFVGSTTRLDYHTGSIATYGKNLRVVNCAPIPNLPTVCTELSLQLTGSTNFSNVTWSVYSDLTRKTRLGGGSVISSGLIRWPIPAILNQHGVHHRFFMTVEGFNWETLQSCPLVYVSPQEVIGP